MLLFIPLNIWWVKGLLVLLVLWILKLVFKTVQALLGKNNQLEILYLTKTRKEVKLQKIKDKLQSCSRCSEDIKNIRKLIRLMQKEDSETQWKMFKEQNIWNTNRKVAHQLEQTYEYAQFGVSNDDNKNFKCKTHKKIRLKARALWFEINNLLDAINTLKKNN